MSVAHEPATLPRPAADGDLVGAAPPSPAGPIDAAELAALPRPPAIRPLAVSPFPAG